MTTIILGVILALLGFLGFISNPLIGANALFVANVAHNLIHLILGAILLGAAFWSRKNSARWLKIVGATTFFLGLIGIFTVSSAGGEMFGFIAANGASNWLNLVAGIVIFIAGMQGKENVGSIIA